MNQLKLASHMLTTPFKTATLVIHVLKIPVNSVLCSLTNDERQYTNWKYVLQKCTACMYIVIPGVEIDYSKQAPMIIFNTYITQFTCSYDGIIIREKITTYLDAKQTYRKLVS